MRFGGWVEKEERRTFSKVGSKILAELLEVDAGDLASVGVSVLSLLSIAERAIRVCTVVGDAGICGVCGRSGPSGPCAPHGGRWMSKERQVAGVSGGRCCA